MVLCGNRGPAMPPPCSAFPRRQLSWPGLHRGREVSAEKEEPHVVVEHMRRHLGQSLTGFQGGIQA